MKNNTSGAKPQKEALAERKLYLGNLNELIRGNYKALTQSERLSIAAINSEIRRIDAKLLRYK